ncbi:hypothetical protein [Actinoplanes siamensis]|uniref:Uncharacterized protein n=1 Tax=Actinoplanes siamensis TaxID=1223317 RepID=A0A919NB86_9ACTN|nr:hypothetical protein [Actinoplanes siamensis]GIF07696.1 hypothetical protein Asi03nite_52340 [Actinoplanes siamensis]
MSRQFRYRMAALAASGLIFGVPLLANGTASAGQLEPGDRRVTFDGGMLGLSCDSRPSVERMTVPAGSTLHVINRTGHDARLELGGKPKGTVPEDGAAEVLFRRGVTRVLLTPDCAGTETPVPVMITAVPSGSASLADPQPSGSGVAMLPAIVAGAAGQASTAGSTLPGGGAQRTRPDRRAPDSSRVLRVPAGERRTARTRTTGDPATPLSGADQKIKSPIPRTTGAADPTFAGMPPGERKALLPADRASLAGLASAAGAVLAGTDPVAPGSAAAPAPRSEDSAAAPAAEPVAAIRPMRTGRPIGLLGLTAVVCAVGVLTAAIRAIVSQRASRTNLA